MIDIRPAGESDIPDIRRLLREYATWIDVDLSFQDFDRELEQLPGDYVPPRGILFVARVSDAIVGCVAAHEWSKDACEMKRLFVTDSARGSGSGRALIASVIDWARQTGYREVLLDTLPVMDQAQKMYTRLGFREVAPYRANPVQGARFLSLDLD